MLWFLVSSPAQYEKLGKDWDKFASQPSGTGPFKLDSWTPDQTTKLSANKDYWMQGKPYVAGIEIRTIPDESSILAGLRAGSIDWAIINDPKVAIRASGGTQKLTVTRTPRPTVTGSSCFRPGRAKIDPQR